MAADGAPGAGGVELPPGLEIPTDEGGPMFAAPWQARVFGTVVALHRRHDEDFDWADFQALLIEEVQAAGPAADASDAEEAYYGQWLRAAERLLQRTGTLDGAEIEARAAAFAAGERNAQEFIEGEHQDAHGHSHDDGHPRDRGLPHDHGHSHDHDHGHETGHEH